MPEEDRKPMQDILDQATEVLRTLPVPPGPSDDLVRITLSRLRPLELAPQAGRLGGRRRILFRIARYGALAATAAVLCMALGSLWLMDRSATPAFASVVANVRKAKSVTYRLAQKLTPRSPTLNQKWYLDGDNIRLELLGIEGQGHDETPPVFEAFVVDFRNKEAVRLDFMQKTVQHIPVGENIPGGFNMIASLRRAKDKDALFITNEHLNGRKTQIYRFTQLHVLGLSGKVKQGETAELWADAASGLPARMVIERLLEGGRGKSSLIFHDFQWNIPLSADLFKAEAPPGFKAATP